MEESLPSVASLWEGLRSIVGRGQDFYFLQQKHGLIFDLSSALLRVSQFPQVLRSTLIFQLWWVDQSIGLLLEFVTVKKKAGWLKGKVSLPSG